MLQKKKLIGIAGFRIVNSFRNGIIYVYMALYIRERLQLSVTESNLLYTLLEFIGAFGQFLIWGYLADRFNARNILIVIGETVPAIGYLGIFVLHKYLLQISSIHAAGLSILFGISSFEIFWGAGFVGFYSLLGDVPNAADRAKYQGYTISLSSAGNITGSILGGLLYDYKYPGGGFEEGILFFVLSITFVGFAALSWLTRKDTEIKFKDRVNDLNFSSDTHNKKDPIHDYVIQSPEEKSKIRIFYWFLVTIMIGTLGQGAIGQITLYYLRLDESVALSSIQVSIITTSRWIAHLFSGPIASRLSEKRAPIGYLGTLIWFSILPLLYPLAGSVYIVIFLFASNGFAMGISSVSSFHIVSRLIPPKRRGRLLSQWNATTMMTWGLGGSLIGGPLADWRISQGASLAAAYTFVFFWVFIMGISSILLTFIKARDALKRSED